MVQPVRTENNNSALDMESLEEMLRKVTTFQQLSTLSNVTFSPVYVRHLYFSLSLSVNCGSIELGRNFTIEFLTFDASFPRNLFLQFYLFFIINDR